jgi:hypothetical protein
MKHVEKKIVENYLRWVTFGSKEDLIEAWKWKWESVRVWESEGELGARMRVELEFGEFIVTNRLFAATASVVLLGQNMKLWQMANVQNHFSNKYMSI